VKTKKAFGPSIMILSLMFCLDWTASKDINLEQKAEELDISEGVVLMAIRSAGMIVSEGVFVTFG
jgi:hypothetical protein